MRIGVALSILLYAYTLYEISQGPHGHYKMSALLFLLLLTMLVGGALGYLIEKVFK